MTSEAYRPFFFGHAWIGEFMVSDLRETANKLRTQADFLDLKADLLAEQMKLADAPADVGSAQPSTTNSENVK